MKGLIFDLIAFSVLVMNIPESLYSQDSPTEVHFPKSFRAQTQTPLGVKKTSTMYILSDFDNRSELKHAQLELGDHSVNSTDGFIHGTHFTSVHNSSHSLVFNDDQSSSGSDTYSALKFHPDARFNNNAEELVKKIDPRLYNINSKLFTPTSSQSKNAYKLADELLLTLFKEYQRWPHQ